MKNKKSNEPEYNLSESTKKENINITCKDGYCFIPNLEESISFIFISKCINKY